MTLVAVFSAPAAAQDAAQQIARCAAIQSDLVRLACFDAIARATKVPASPPTPLWRYYQTRDAIDDTERAGIFQEVTTEDGDRVGAAIFCVESRALIAFAVPSHGYDAAARENADMTFRFDSEEPLLRLLRATDDSLLTFSVEERQAEVWSRMLRSKKMAIRLVTKGYSTSNRGARTVTAVFDLNGLPEAAKKLKGCPTQ